jgi:hypothetical protein
MVLYKVMAVPTMMYESGALRTFTIKEEKRIQVPEMRFSGQVHRTEIRYNA